MEQLDFNLGALRASAAAKQYYKDIVQMIQPAQKDAYNAIFVLLPQLIDRLEKELQLPSYQLDKPAEIIRQRLEFPSINPTQDVLAATAIPNYEIVSMHTWAEKAGEDLRRALDDVLLWFYVLIPKRPQSGSNRNQEVLVALTSECQKAYDRTNAFYEEVTQYHQNRADLIRECRKNANSDLLLALVYFDAQEARNCRAYVLETMQNSMTLYTGIIYNYESILKNMKVEKLGVIY